MCLSILTISDGFLIFKPYSLNGSWLPGLTLTSLVSKLRMEGGECGRDVLGANLKISPCFNVVKPYQQML